MKRTKIKLSEERKVITNMIVDTNFLKEIMPLFKTQYFESSYARLIFRWIREYWENFNEAPGKNIRDIYLQKCDSIKGEDENELVADFLENLSEQYEKNKITNIRYSVGKAIRWLKLQSLKLLNEKIKECVRIGDPITGEQHIANFKKIEKVKGEDVRILRDPGKVISAFLMENELLFTLPKVLGRVLGTFARGDLVAFLAASGKGKTWWEMYCGMTGMFFGYNIVFFNLEMPEPQIVRRVWQSLNGLPKENKKIRIPYFEKDEDDKYFVKIKMEEREAVSVEHLDKEQANFRFQFKGGDIRIISLPNDSITPYELQAHLDNLEYYSGFLPDVIVIDYADLLKVPDQINRLAYRHQLDYIWKSLRRIALERNCLVVTATQADRSSYSKDAGEQNIAEDIRKFNHVAKMIVINQTKEEYKQGVSRLSILKERDDRRYVEEVVVLQCLDIGRPYIDCQLRRNVKLSEKKRK